MVLAESAGQPAVATLARSAYEQLARGEEVSYQQLDALVGEVSGKGVLRALHARHSPAAYESIILPILAEIDRQKPVAPRYRGQP
jgi:hypothetical protein